MSRLNLPSLLVFLVILKGRYFESLNFHYLLFKVKNVRFSQRYVYTCNLFWLHSKSRRSDYCFKFFNYRFQLVTVIWEYATTRTGHNTDPIMANMSRRIWTPTSVVTWFSRLLKWTETDWWRSNGMTNQRTGCEECKFLRKSRVTPKWFDFGVKKLKR